MPFGQVEVSRADCAKNNRIESRTFALNRIESRSIAQNRIEGDRDVSAEDQELITITVLQDSSQELSRVGWITTEQISHSVVVGYIAHIRSPGKEVEQATHNARYV